jgi:FkbM family methyltransferase
MSSTVLARAAKLRDPSSVRVAVLRRRLGALLRRRADPRGLRLERLGSEYGGWTVPVDLVGDGWTTWSLGTGHDASFDVEMLARCPAGRVRAFDPFARNLEGARTLADDHPRYSGHQVAIAGGDAPLVLYGDPDPDSGSIGPRVPGRDQSTFTVDGRSVATLQRELGDPAIDLLKMDIEGAEYDVLDGLDLRAAGVQVLCCELHFNVSLARARTTIAGVYAQGYRLVAADETDATFVRETDR